MALMEFLKANKLNTTTMLVVPAANTGTQAFLFNRNTRLGFTSVNYNSTTAAVISVVFGQPTVLSNILLQNHNLRQFRVYYDSVTANSLGIVTGNSATSTYLSFASVTVSSVDIQMDNTIAGSVEKALGELVLTERRLQLERNPGHGDWKPIFYRKKIRHEMPDGGTKQLVIRDKFRAKLEWEFVTNSFRESLLSVYEDGSPVYFAAYPTTTGWDGRAYEVNWTNDWDFTYSSNNKDSGQGGSIVLEETPGG